MLLDPLYQEILIEASSQPQPSDLTAGATLLHFRAATGGRGRPREQLILKIVKQTD